MRRSCILLTEIQETDRGPTQYGYLRQVLPAQLDKGSERDYQSLRGCDDYLLSLAAEEVARWGCRAAFC
ncbi:hypothetical protein CJ030_MR8G027194 [Morella rubra]|uniref:Uncharacterized protein n=1 Tax=Morella rubra TaxID=262757 RepID=A0A6A1UVU2_9ROSI|nr:hypothetical protein CJ030_MR8G027194 [Morella rubra]